MHRRLYPIVAVLLVFVLSTAAYPQLKKRVAVFTFEDKTDHSWGWWDGKSPGDGMADMLTTELVKSGKYTVIERQEIQSLMDEQNLGMTGRVTEQSAAQIGKLLGVELALVGAVTEFGYTQGEKGGRFGGFGVGLKNQKATVAVDVRFINTSTGEIIAAENIRKEESSGGISVSTPQIDFNNQNDFDNSIVGKATRACIEDIMGLIEKQMTSVAWEGKIILVQGATLFIKPGEDAGVKVGDTFAVYSQGQDLIDPDTGLSLGSEEAKIGMIEVTSLVSGGKAAKAVAKMGSGFQKGDVIRLK
jgi:curli biogenesis system outer membrane secretion channel CsgG